MEVTVDFSVAINPFVPNAPFLYPLKTSENECFKECGSDSCVNKNAQRKDNFYFHFFIRHYLLFLYYHLHATAHNV